MVNSRATGRQPLCMEQFGRLVNAYRMPGKIFLKVVQEQTLIMFRPNILVTTKLINISGLVDQDELVCTSPTETHEREHVIVFANGYVSVSNNIRFFKKITKT